MGILCSDERQYKLIGLIKNEEFKELNSVLQCLCHIEPLYEYFKNKFTNIQNNETYKSFHENNICLTDSFKDVIDKIWPKTKRKIRSEEQKDVSKEFLGMIKKIKFTGNGFNDNENLLIFILERIHKELNKAKNNINLI